MANIDIYFGLLINTVQARAHILSKTVNTKNYIKEKCILVIKNLLAVVFRFAQKDQEDI